jgi:hypothetical protein
VDIGVAELLERVKKEPDGNNAILLSSVVPRLSSCSEYQEFTIGDSRSPVQFLMTCLVKALPSSVADYSFSQDVASVSQ